MNPPSPDKLPQEVREAGYYWYDGTPLSAGKFYLVEVFRPCWVDVNRQDLAWRYLDRSCPDDITENLIVNSKGRFVHVPKPNRPSPAASGEGEGTLKKCADVLHTVAANLHEWELGGNATKVERVAQILVRLANTAAAPKDSGEDTRRLDWLSENLSYIVLARHDVHAMEMLKNNGRGWTNGELRAAIDRAMNPATGGQA